MNCFDACWPKSQTLINPNESSEQTPLSVKKHYLEGTSVQERVDSIECLWEVLPALCFQHAPSSTVIYQLRLGLELCQMLFQNNQAELVRDRLSALTSRLIRNIAEGIISTEGLELTNVAHICDIAVLSLPVYPDPINCTDELENICRSMKTMVSLPDELNSIIRPCVLMDRVLLDLSINLLVNERMGISATPTVLYGRLAEGDGISASSCGHASGFSDTSGYSGAGSSKDACGSSSLSGASGFSDTLGHIPETANHALSQARKRLAQMKQGQKLMMPLLRLDNRTGFASHFSAIFTMRMSKGFRFFILDSGSTSCIDVNKEHLLKSLTPLYSQSELYYYCRPFQHNNDCGIHTYNLLRLCVDASGLDNTDPLPLRQLFNDYEKKVVLLNKNLKGNELATSCWLRMSYVIDCVQRGYKTEAYNDPDFLSQLYKARDHQPIWQDQSKRSYFNSLWRQWGDFGVFKKRH